MRPTPGHEPQPLNRVRLQRALLPISLLALAVSTSACASGQGEEKAEAVRTFLDWSLQEAPQKQAAELGFVQLTGDVLKRARTEVAKIRN